MLRVIRFTWLFLVLLLMGCGGGAEATPTPLSGATPSPTAIVAPATPTPVVVAPTATPLPTAEEPRYGGILVGGCNICTITDLFVATHGLAKPGTAFGPSTHTRVQAYLLKLRREWGGAPELRGELVESWSYDQGSTVLTLNLRPAVKWHDGTPFTADHVATFLQEQLDPPAGWVSPTRGFLGPVIRSVEATGTRTVVLTLRQPSASLLNNLTRFLIEPVHIPQGQELREPVGLGPFTHVKTERDVSVEVRKNPDYFEKDAQGRQLPFLDGVKIFRIFDRTLWLSAMRTGRIRLGGGTETPAIQTNVEALRKDVPGIVLDDWPTPAHGPRFKYIPPFTDPRVIEAISLWTDRKAIVDISGGGSYLSTTAIPAEFGGRWALPIEETTNWPGYRYVDSTGKLVTALEEIKAKWKELRKDPRDLERAKQLLAEAGIRQGQVSMEMLVPTFAISLYAPPFLSEMKTLFGATWSQRNDPGGGRGAVDVQEGRFQLMWGSGMTFDPDEPFSAFSSDLIGSGVVGLGNADPTRLGWPAEHPGLVKVRRLFDEQDKTLDVVKRRELIWELQRAILNSGYYVVLMDPVGWSAYWPEVRGTNDMYGCCGIAPFGWVTEQVWLRQ